MSNYDSSDSASLFGPHDSPSGFLHDAWYWILSVVCTLAGIALFWWLTTMAFRHVDTKRFERDEKLVECVLKVAPDRVAAYGCIP